MVLVSIDRHQGLVESMTLKKEMFMSNINLIMWVFYLYVYDVINLVIFFKPVAFLSRIKYMFERIYYQKRLLIRLFEENDLC
jgi:hypothetical protein